MPDLQFGFSLAPTTDLAEQREMVAAAEEGGLDVVGVQDHPYIAKFVDTFTLIGDLLTRTERLRLFPDVANLPLRPPAMLAKAAASMDLLSGGRFELGIGAGGFWDAITRYGVPRRRPPEALAALEEAITILRSSWRGEIVDLDGEYYQATRLHAGPVPPHPIGIWVGSQGPASLRLTGRLADGWAAPIPRYLPYEEWSRANATIDGAARAAGRDPADVVRIAQLVGTVTDESGDTSASAGADPVRGTPDQWAELIARLSTELPFSTFVLWPETPSVAQVERFAREVVPAVHG